MKHLFIVNPVAYKIKGRHGELVREIGRQMRQYGLVYKIHITRWERDTVGFMHQYTRENLDGLLRVHMFRYPV
jgi:hypothetical protein